MLVGENSVQFEETTIERSTSMTMVNMPTPPKVLKKKVLPWTSYHVIYTMVEFQKAFWIKNFPYDSSIEFTDNEFEGNKKEATRSTE